MTTFNTPFSHPQGPEHPNPGQQYSARGFPRYGYLPDNERGSKVSIAIKTQYKVNNVLQLYVITIAVKSKVKDE